MQKTISLVKSKNQKPFQKYACTFRNDHSSDHQCYIKSLTTSTLNFCSKWNISAIEKVFVTVEKIA